MWRRHPRPPARGLPLPGSRALVHKPRMLIAPLPTAADRARERQRRSPERETLWLAATSAAKVLGRDHSATRAFAQAASTMDRVDLWRAKLASRTLRPDQRQAIAGAVEE